MPVDPFSFDLPPSLPGRATALVARSLLTRLAGLDALRELYASIREGPDETFLERVLEALAIDAVVDPVSLERLRSGRLIVAANHPRGAVDGLVLFALLRRVRADVRLVANRLLSRVPELRSTCLFVDPSGERRSTTRSLGGLRAAQAWLRQDGALILFPAGEVAGRTDEHGLPCDGPWSDTLGRLAVRTGATVVPAFLGGRNSRLFYAAGRLHPALRTLLLGRELLAANGASVRVAFGDPVPLHLPHTVSARASHAVTLLARGSSPQNERTPATEVSRLGPAAHLLRCGRFAVLQASADQVPATLREIGRLRARTFAAAGEGSGSEIDLDDFDRHYLHLFVWDDERQVVVGAYRLGASDQIVRDRGVTGLYTRTLFDFDTRLIEALSPALELGRSFVRAEYQRDHLPLLLLWRGIGKFLVRHPRYRRLFGPASISARYDAESRGLIASFLETNCRDERLAQLVTPKHPPAVAAAVRTAPGTARELDREVSARQADGQGMPVLLRQYLKLGAKALGISVDPAFGNVTDVLVSVDLDAVEPALLRRYLGEDGLSTYMAHRLPRLSPAA